MAESCAPRLPGLRIKLIDGNCIEKSQHRIEEPRSVSAGPPPGKSLVVYDPLQRLPIDVFPCEDGHAQERSLFKTVLQTIEKSDAWIADRNFRTVGFTCGIADRDAFFVIREHKKYPRQLLDKEKYIDWIETGKVYEQLISVADDAGREHTFRRIRVKLKKVTRDSDTDIFIISDLSKTKADDRNRFSASCRVFELENKHIRLSPSGFVRFLCRSYGIHYYVGYKVRPFGRVHGTDVIENQVSGYYPADEISGTYRGMMIAIDDAHWVVFQQMTLAKLVKTLKYLAADVKLSAFRKHPRAPKKPRPKRKSRKNTPHVSTAKILVQRTK